MQSELTTYLSAAAGQPRSFDEICEDSRIAVSDSDAAAWRIGDNAVEVLARFNELTLADYAREIGKPKGTISEYRQMSAYFDQTARAELADACPNVTRSHMRKVLSIKDRAAGRAFVEHCSEKGWTVDQFGYILKRYKRLKGIGRAAPPKPVTATFEATGVSSWSSDGPRINMWLADQERLHQIVAEHPAARVTVTIEYTPKEAT